MRTRIHTFAMPSEIGDFADEVRRTFLELGRMFGADSLAGECSPPIDVYETDETIEVVVDLPGVEPGAVRLMAKGGQLLVAGDKAPRRAHADSSFHLVERGYGRFARVVRLGAACDTARARARFVSGELQITVPKVGERRGQAIAIAIEAAPGPPSANRPPQ
ncbi:MAG TPA: Hsp20/alpha crystallin family protein [Vicinamibacterales bacterium]|nr:Hsp20/alpha crystallin family protein [Vicinamibacterales bacterium]